MPEEKKQVQQGEQAEQPKDAEAEAELADLDVSDVDTSDVEADGPLADLELSEVDVEGVRGGVRSCGNQCCAPEP